VIGGVFSSLDDLIRWQALYFGGQIRIAHRAMTEISPS
jgi:hypothetical protein